MGAGTGELKWGLGQRPVCGAMPYYPEFGYYMPMPYLWPSRPIRVDTADIDVTKPRRILLNRPEQALRRGRSVVRIRTMRRQPRPSPGALLVEKFIIKEKKPDFEKPAIRAHQADFIGSRPRLDLGRVESEVRGRTEIDKLSGVNNSGGSSSSSYESVRNYGKNDPSRESRNGNNDNLSEKVSEKLQIIKSDTSVKDKLENKELIEVDHCQENNTFPVTVLNSINEENRCEADITFQKDSANITTVEAEQHLNSEKSASKILNCDTKSSICEPSTKNIQDNNTPDYDSQVNIKIQKVKNKQPKSKVTGNENVSKKSSQLKNCDIVEKNDLELSSSLEQTFDSKPIVLKPCPPQNGDSQITQNNTNEFVKNTSEEISVETGNDTPSATFTLNIKSSKSKTDITSDDIYNIDNKKTISKESGDLTSTETVKIKLNGNKKAGNEILTGTTLTNNNESTKTGKSSDTVSFKHTVSTNVAEKKEVATGKQKDLKPTKANKDKTKLKLLNEKGLATGDKVNSINLETDAKISSAPANNNPTSNQKTPTKPCRTNSEETLISKTLENTSEKDKQCIAGKDSAVSVGQDHEATAGEINNSKNTIKVHEGLDKSEKKDITQSKELLTPKCEITVTDCELPSSEKCTVDKNNNSQLGSVSNKDKGYESGSELSLEEEEVEEMEESGVKKKKKKIIVKKKVNKPPNGKKQEDTKEAKTGNIKRQEKRISLVDEQLGIPSVERKRSIIDDIIEQEAAYLDSMIQEEMKDTGRRKSSLGFPAITSILEGEVGRNGEQEKGTKLEQLEEHSTEEELKAEEKSDLDNKKKNKVKNKASDTTSGEESGKDVKDKRRDLWRAKVAQRSGKTLGKFFKGKVKKESSSSSEEGKQLFIVARK